MENFALSSSLAGTSLSNLELVFPDQRHLIYSLEAYYHKQKNKEQDPAIKNNLRQEFAEINHKEWNTESLNARAGFGQVQTVPPTNTAAFHRPVIVRISMGGSTVYNSFNHNGSLTILINEFLDRLTKEIKPSLLTGIDHMVFRMQGSYFRNSFNG